jgi:Flagellar basal body rod FlgEFG protein C-terminal
VDLSAIAQQGLERSQDRFDHASSQLASAGLPPIDSSGDTVNLRQAAVALLSAKDDFAANLKVMKTADEMQRGAINLLN